MLGFKHLTTGCCANKQELITQLRDSMQSSMGLYTPSAILSAIHPRDKNTLKIDNITSLCRTIKKYNTHLLWSRTAITSIEKDIDKIYITVNASMT